MTKIARFLTNEEQPILTVAEVIKDLQDLPSPENRFVFFPADKENNSILYSPFAGFGLAQNVSSKEMVIIPLINSEHSSKPDMTVYAALLELKKLDPNLPVMMEIAVFAKVS